jgi:hypothetical protein
LVASQFPRAVELGPPLKLWMTAWPFAFDQKLIDAN